MCMKSTVMTPVEYTFLIAKFNQIADDNSQFLTVYVVINTFFVTRKTLRLSVALTEKIKMKKKLHRNGKIYFWKIIDPTLNIHKHKQTDVDVCMVVERMYGRKAGGRTEGRAIVWWVGGLPDVRMIIQTFSFDIKLFKSPH